MQALGGRQRRREGEADACRHGQQEHRTEQHERRRTPLLASEPSAPRQYWCHSALEILFESSLSMAWKTDSKASRVPSSCLILEGSRSSACTSLLLLSDLITSMRDSVPFLSLSNCSKRWSMIDALSSFDRSQASLIGTSSLALWLFFLSSALPKPEGPGSVELTMVRSVRCGVVFRLGRATRGRRCFRRACRARGLQCATLLLL